MKNKQKKIEMLKRIEGLIYQIASYLLNDAESAVEATKRTIIRAMRHDVFFQMDEAERIQFIRNLTIRHSLELYSSRQMALKIRNS